MSAPSGWYADPYAAGARRFWDGPQWTPYTDVPASAPPAAPLRAPEGARTETVWIWLVVLLPLPSLVLTLFIPWGSLFAFDMTAADPSAMIGEAMGAYLSPIWIVTSVVGWATFGLGVYFAYRDHGALLAAGVPRPFHWAWSFLAPVYAFGRPIVVKSRTGSGLAPLWVAIAVQALGLVVAAIATSVMLAAFSTSMTDLFRLLAPSASS